MQFKSTEGLVTGLASALQQYGRPNRSSNREFVAVRRHGLRMRRVDRRQWHEEHKLLQLATAMSLKSYEMAYFFGSSSDLVPLFGDILERDSAGFLGPQHGR